MKVSKTIIGRILLAVLAVAAIVLVVVNGVIMVTSPPDDPPKPAPENTTNPKIIPASVETTVEGSTVSVVTESYYYARLPW